MITSLLEEKIKEVLNELGYDDNVKVVVSNRPDLCDYQFDGAFRLAKLLHKAPMVIADEIVSYIKKIEDFNLYFNNVEACNPGFVNISLSDKFINNQLNLMITNDKFNLKKVEHIYNYGEVKRGLLCQLLRFHQR